MDLTPAEWSAILAGAERLELKKGHVISQRGSRRPFLYVLDSGALRCFVLDDHQWTVAEEGTLFGDLSAFRSSQRSVMTISVESDEATIFQLSMPFLFSYMQVYPAQGVRLFRMICQRMSLMLHAFLLSPEESDFIVAETPAIVIEPQHEVNIGFKLDEKLPDLTSLPIILGK